MLAPLLALLLTPLAVPAGVRLLAAVARGLRGEPAAPLEWTLLLVFGPALPVYLLVIPLLPFAVRALRRGWRPRPLHIALGVVVASLAFDVVFYLGGPGGS